MQRSLVEAIEAALAVRGPLIASLEETDMYRLFHGAVEGRPGLTVDRYGPLLLVQTFREPLAAGELDTIIEGVEASIPGLLPVWNHRGGGGAKALLRRDFARWHRPDPAALADCVGRELGLRYRLRARHRGMDPLLFLDLRAGRRWVRENAAGASALNLFAYTCGLGVAAAAGGASEVWNLDFAGSALAVGEENAALNGLDGPGFETREADCLTALRQLAGLPLRGRGARAVRHPPFAPRAFDLVLLDPPTWAKSPFGAVDLVRDYAALFKPAALCAAPGGRVLATNHVSTVDLGGWIEGLRRCAAKAGRPAREVEILAPEADFPSPDGRHPLKIALVSF